MAEATNLRKRRLIFRRRKRKPPERSMTVIEHLDELRARLIKSFVALALLAVAAFVLYEPISDFLIRPFCELPRNLRGDDACRLTTFGPLEGFNVRLKVTAMVAIIAASPVWLYQLWAFITPGLTVREKRYALPFVLSSITLFLIGTTFAYLTLPAALRFLVAIGGENVQPLMRAQEYLNFVGLMLIAFGLSFELPLVLFFLGLAGVISVDQLRRQRKVAAVGTAALAAIVTPTQDPFTMLAMWVPLYLLYELSIALLRLVARRRARADSQPL